MVRVFFFLLSVLFWGIGCQEKDGKKAENSDIAAVENLSVEQMAEQIKQNKGIILDVRTPEEYAEGHLNNAQLYNIHDDDFKERIAKLDKEQPYYVYCKAGGRSSKASNLMVEMGFKKVYNMDGGFSAWQTKSLPFDK